MAWAAITIGPTVPVGGLCQIECSQRRGALCQLFHTSGTVWSHGKELRHGDLLGLTQRGALGLHQPLSQRVINAVGGEGAECCSLRSTQVSGRGVAGRTVLVVQRLALLCFCRGLSRRLRSGRRDNKQTAQKREHGQQAGAWSSHYYSPIQ